MSGRDWVLAPGLAKHQISCPSAVDRVGVADSSDLTGQELIPEWRDGRKRMTTPMPPTQCCFLCGIIVDERS